MRGSVPPGLAPLAGEWSAFFIAGAGAGASAPLAGLSFVAVSAHSSILRQSRPRYKAQRTLVAFVVVLMGALILAMPRPPADATTNVLLWSSAAGAAVTITSIVRESQSRKPRAWLRVALSLNAVEFLLGYSSAAGWALLHLSPDNQPLSPYILGSGMGAAVGWAALQTWRLMQVAVRARWQPDHPAPRDQPDGGPSAAPVQAQGGAPAPPEQHRAEQHRAEQHRDRTR